MSEVAWEKLDFKAKAKLLLKKTSSQIDQNNTVKYR